MQVKALCKSSPDSYNLKKSELNTGQNFLDRWAQLSGWEKGLLFQSSRDAILAPWPEIYQPILASSSNMKLWHLDIGDNYIYNQHFCAVCDNVGLN